MWYVSVRRCSVSGKMFAAGIYIYINKMSTCTCT